VPNQQHSKKKKKEKRKNLMQKQKILCKNKTKQDKQNKTRQSVCLHPQT
jgi:hypothetical protein